jgi:hypothetical protein
MNCKSILTSIYTTFEGKSGSTCTYFLRRYESTKVPSKVGPYSARTKVRKYFRTLGTKVLSKYEGKPRDREIRASLLFVQRGRAKRSARRPRRLRSRRVRPRPTASDRRALDVVPRARAAPRAAPLSRRPRGLTPPRGAKKNSPRDVLRGQAPHQGHPELLPGE